MALTSEPACGSEMAIAVGTPPLAMMGRKRFLCSSEPKCNSGMMNMVFRPASEPQAGETREITQGDLVHIPPNAVHSLRPVSDHAPIHCFCFAVGTPDAGEINYTEH